jgi:type II secretory ATPase GspE/PulE/Tfp pilus assembly ATPase PilB-like protein
MNEKLRELVLSGASGAELFECALATGMKTMRQSAIEKVLAGQVPASEIMRVFAMEED